MYTVEGRDKGVESEKVFVKEVSAGGDGAVGGEYLDPIRSEVDVSMVVIDKA